MKITVCETPDLILIESFNWQLEEYLQKHKPDLILLPELWATKWFAVNPVFEAETWENALGAHEAYLAEVDAPLVLATRPVEVDGQRLNQGYYWTPDDGAVGVHYKYYLPDEEGFYETAWFDRPAPEFKTATVGEVRLGFLICSEVMFTERARHYGRAGANLIAAPRATGGHRRWPIALQMAAITAGAFVISSNRQDHPWGEFAGQGYIIAPDGEILAVTSEAKPFVTVDVDLARADEAKRGYPCYLPE